jgi:type II secretory ATPase GspE/PulE/Tfp pilus assembly ATPase PilB-like protein
MGDKGSLMGRFLGNAEKFSDKQVAETLQLLVLHGFKRGASDIHIEPHDRYVLVRYRIDGALRGVHKLPQTTLEPLMAGLKKQAGLAHLDSHLPQEGEYTAHAQGVDLTVRASTMPVYGGEKAVLHLSPKLGKPQKLAALGFWGNGLRTLESVLASPHGLVLVSGPRHSGVHATLFSLLEQLNNPLASIATVELRTKHRIPGVSQTYLAASGMSVYDGLRATLQQDPNIIMLGDIPDGRTAELAVHTAATGHLVVAGTHADGAIAAAIRLKGSGVEPFMLTTALRTSVGQRLVRALCNECRERYALTADEHRTLRQNFGITSPATLKHIFELEQDAVRSGLGDPKHYGSTPTHISYLWRASEHGCDACQHSGYQGRTALVEVLPSSELIQKALMSHEITSVAALHRIALQAGFTPLALDGLIKALRGQTTIKEVLHAAGSTMLA